MAGRNKSNSDYLPPSTPGRPNRVPARPVPAPPPDLVYDDCGEISPVHADNAPPLPQRPYGGRPPLPVPEPQQEVYDDLDPGPIVQQIDRNPGPIVQQISKQIPKRQVLPPLPSPEASIYELGDDDVKTGSQNHPPPPSPPPPFLEDPGGVYELEPDVDPAPQLPPPPPHPLSPIPQPPPKNRRPAQLPSMPPPAVISPGPKSGTAIFGSINMEDARKGLRKVSLDNLDAASGSSADPKIYGECPESVGSAIQTFQDRGKPGFLNPQPQVKKPDFPVASVVPKANADKPNNARLPPAKPQLIVKPAAKFNPTSREPEVPEDIYDDATSIVQDPLMKHAWYFGRIDRSTCDSKVKAVGKDGTYLVRLSDREEKFPYTLVVFHKGHVNNLRIRKRDDRKVALGDEKSSELAFKDVEKLIEHHQQHNVVLLGNNQSQVKLLHVPSKFK